MASSWRHVHVKEEFELTKWVYALLNRFLGQANYLKNDITKRYESDTTILFRTTVNHLNSSKEQLVGGDKDDHHRYVNCRSQVNLVDFSAFNYPDA